MMERSQDTRADAAVEYTSTITTRRQYVRFTRLNRILHVVMIISFLSLALTGMILKFSYTAWSVMLAHLFGGFASAGYIHRLAATAMIATFIVHLFDLTRRKNREYGSWKKMLFGPDSMLFNRKDWKDFVGNIRWFLGKGPRPDYGRWTYWEKFDYFAVFWGMAVIGSTGLVLWFPEFFTLIFPGWMINVASIIHSDEALLAVGFIFTVHFFNTHLRPEKFPMDLVVFTGRMDIDELKEDKPAEYRELIRSGTLQDHLADEYPSIVIRVIRVFGWGAVSIGLSVVTLIIYAMIFSYR